MFQRQHLPNLNLLRVFEAAGRLSSFKLAAEELFVTPSAVSQQIKILEEQLGISLFIRKNRSLALTPEGKDYWQEIHWSLTAIHQKTIEISRHHQQILKISIMPPVASRVVFPNLSNFHQTYPEINLQIDASIKYADILNGEADIAIRFGSPPWQGLHHHKLCDAYIQVVCPPGYSNEFGLKKHPKNIAKVPLIHMSERPGAWERWFEETGFGQPTGKQIYLDDYPSAMEAAESLGAMLALIPIEAPLIKTGRLEAPFPALGPLDESIYAVYREGNHQQAAIESFIHWLSLEISKLS